MSLRLPLSFICAVCVVALPPSDVAAEGPDFIEEGDAGSLPGMAQPVEGEGVVSRIRGALAGINPGDPDFEDMYLINITDAFLFRISTVVPDRPGVAFDTQLWLFAVPPPTDEVGLLGNNDAPPGELKLPGGSLLLNASDDGTGIEIVPGLYYLAISGLGNVPLSLGGEIFNIDPSTPFEISGPDGPGGGEAINGWSGRGEVGAYEMELQGVSFIPVPAPGTGLILLLGLGLRRRRRS